MQKKHKIVLITIIIILIIGVAALGIVKYLKKPQEEKIKNVTNIISNISDYGYSLDDRDTTYMEDTFKELEEILNSQIIDYEEYAKSLTKLFIIDFYTLSNKINKYDVGGLEYILSDKVEIFKTKAMDTIYKDIIDNTYKDRIQELPEIKEVKIVNIEQTKITINESETDCYKVDAEYIYKKDLGYDIEGTIYLIKNNNKLEIAKYEAKEREK